MQKMMNKIPLIVGLMALSNSAIANNNVEFTGTLLIPPPCTVFEDKVHTIEYKDISLHKINGTNYIKPINYALDCKDNLHGWDLVLTIKGDKSGFDDAALKTEHDDLGMRILLNGVAFDIDKPIKITYGQPPILEVVPVKKPGSTLPVINFSATGTLLAEYQ